MSARVQLRYKLGHASLIATYEKFTSAGSGFFAGANTQAARSGIRARWDALGMFYGDLGYSHNTETPECGVWGCVNAASSYNEGSAGAVLRKHLGRTYDFFAAYRFGEWPSMFRLCVSGSAPAGFPAAGR